MTAYYNEHEPYAAEWLRNLIVAGLIAPGDVDERDIRDVRPAELRGYTQCHFFAGIGVWSFALRSAGWADDRPVWTGSCPCQPFSVAGRAGGFADERHLWPHWHHLISECRPRVVFGEQVEAAIKHGWLDLVQSDMEGIGYAFAAAGIPAAGVGAPHIRQRLWFVADSNDLRLEQAPGAGLRAHVEHDTEPLGTAGRLDNTDDDARLEGFAGHGDERPGRAQPAGSVAEAGAACEFCGYAFDVELLGRYGCPNCEGQGADDGADDARPTDGQWRPVEPGTFPLVNGVTTRVGRLRAYGNAIVAGAAQAVIEAYMEYRP